MKFMKFTKFENLVGLTSLFIASCAAFFSIVGIGMLFSGSSIAAMLMAGSLELGKLVATSFLYRYWTLTKGFLKIYLTVAVFVLMLITSLGIFGYLSSAYQQSSIEDSLLQEKIKVIEDQKITIKDKINSSKLRISNITELRNSQELRLSQSMTNILIARNPIQLKQIQEQTKELIDQSELSIQKENEKIQLSIDDLQKLDSQIGQLKIQSGSKKDLQTFKFVADEFGVNINKVAKWFIIALISVFDPLAICLLLAYNTTINKNYNVTNFTKPTSILEKENINQETKFEEGSKNTDVSTSESTNVNEPPSETPAQPAVEQYPKRFFSF
jgi:hypothetical protein